MDESLIRSNLKLSENFHLYVLNEIDSTNSFLGQLGNKDALEWTVVVAEKQTAGKGRLSRKWQSPAGVGLWFSILLRPNIRPDDCHLLNLLIAVLLADYLERKIKSITGKKIDINLKWPNDLYIKNKKLAGILLQTSITATKVNFLVLGIGLNVNQGLVDFPNELKKKAVSLRMETDKIWDREELLSEFLEFFHENYNFYFPEKQKEILDLYQNKVLFKNEIITVDFNGNKVEGIFKGLSSQGYLILQNGKEERIITTGEMV